MNLSQIKIFTGNELSEEFSLPYNISSNNGLAYLITESEIIENTELLLYTKTSNSLKWYPFYDILKNKNASIPLIKNVFIPLNPFIDGRGATHLKFGVSQLQTNDVIIEIGTTIIF